FDDGTRDLPDSIEDRPLAIRRRTTPGLEPEEAAEISGEFGRVSPLHKRGWLPNTNFSLSVGDSTKLAGRRLGFLGSLGYRYGLQLIDASARKLANVSDEGSDIREVDSATGTGTMEKVLIGMLGAVSYELAKNHDVRVVSMLTQNAEDFTFIGYTPMLDSFNDQPANRTVFRFIERQLFFNQLLAHHDFDAVVFDWQLNASTVQRDQPDSVDLFRVGDPERLNFEADTTRLWSELDQVDFGGGADVTVPIDETKLKAGYMGRTGDRELDARKFAPTEVRGAEIDFELPSYLILDPANAGTQFTYNEITRDDDGFVADEQLHAGYAMIDTPTVAWLRFTAGARVESSTQSITTGSRYRPNPMFEPEISKTTTDVLPAAALTFALSESMNIRAAYGGTVARPVVRELAPVINTDFVRKRNIVGNPDLRRTYIHNLDLRWELFPSDVEVLAASAFYKIFQDPIESIVTRNGDYSFKNIKGATNFGAELEARVGLDRVLKAFDGWSAGANFAIIQSEIQMRPEEQLLATNDERAMAGQSPYVANLSLSYATDASPLGLNLFYNVFGRRIRDAGTEELPDTYEEAFHSLDFSGSYKLGSYFTLGASATNLLFYPIRVTQGDFVVFRAEEGLTLGVSLGFKNK
ncbi:MAG TPA: TonB-dependent receptor, partial [Polyangiales bacterium]|nr:TonB-dependent receptor [Polyangiales bacterium]